MDFATHLVHKLFVIMDTVYASRALYLCLLFATFFLCVDLARLCLCLSILFFFNTLVLALS